MSDRAGQVSRRAREIHEGAILIDGHNDHLMLKFSRGRPFDFMRPARRYHSDGRRLLAGGMTASLFMVGGYELGPSLALVERARREIERHPDALLLVTRAADIPEAKRTGRLGVMLSWESGQALEGRLEVLGAAHRLGLRASTLTHGEGGGRFALQGTRSAFRHCTARERAALRRRSRGLTAFGRGALREMQRLGILVDLAHANDATVEDALELARRPVVSTHGGVFACCRHYRCSTDEQIRGIAATGGLVSVAFYDQFIAEPPAKATVDGIVDQIAHVAGLVGIEHVGIGTDFDGLADGVWPVIRTAERLPELTEALVRRGFSAAEIRKVWGGNYLRVLRAAVG